MIIRETEEAFILIAQHEHARLSGQIAGHLGADLFGDESLREDVLLAVYEHDRSWIRLDDAPIWNDRAESPFSFTDYPLLPKLLCYRVGLDEIERMSAYAALLCSKHFASFQDLRQSKRQACIDFCREEALRQERILNSLSCDEAQAEKHFRLLQLCDDLSLYVCMNEPGADKEHEHPWFRFGFKLSEALGLGDKLMAEGADGERIALTPFPLERACTVSLKYKRVAKELAGRLGIDQAYKESAWLTQEATFAGHS
ncbi:DUF3891 family protein [Paenibacillus doosanensis]|uniref:DUF3891 domain-containing protein n=1 Tax=Paenibacillus konkukensis TaxID=2020716 RepID=A0ABY4RYL2_9BACL|nr:MULTISPECIES: DUF3891 family protein [Paenibacillus]MCS7458652.1 DUF3891 family protein [Paenibacillus doosanensis]UQZ86824.1 hypothetical protein SK3146_06117 [Paenibacillus konkukensis]